MYISRLGGILITSTTQKVCQQGHNLDEDSRCELQIPHAHSARIGRGKKQENQASRKGDGKKIPFSFLKTLIGADVPSH